MINAENQIVDATTNAVVGIAADGTVAKHAAFSFKDGFKASFFCKNLDESSTLEPKFDIGYALGNAVICVGLPIAAYAARRRWAPKYDGYRSWKRTAVAEGGI